MSDFTLVTGLWDIKRGDLTEFNRSFDHYLENFDRLLSLDMNMVVYAPAELKRFIDTRRSYRNTRIVTREIEEFRTRFDLFDKVNNIRQKPEWYTQASWLENSPQAKLEYYNPIVMSKYFMVHDATFSGAECKYYFWIDGGLTNTVDLNLLQNIDRIKEYMKTIDDKFLFLSYPYEPAGEVHGFEAQKFAEYCGVEKTEYVCRGGFFGGSKEKIRRFNGEYYGLLSRSLSEGYMGTEECIHTMLAYLYPEDVHRFELDWNGLVYPFFEHLGTIERKTSSNAELIPYVKNKSLEDIKTSLYVLTFNSPKQFETLVLTYEKNDPNFLKYMRKILVDNSTNKDTYAEYSELCDRFGFEHIKKVENLGICGARQFVAEHFNESDSEYYLFLEDDMNLHDPTDELCVSGYHKFVDDLYFKALAIVHRNRYDYLKLSYSEFFGTNETQWAWYNVPQTVREQFFPDKPSLPEEGLDPDAPKTQIYQEKRHKDLHYYEGDYYYCNWPLFFSRKGNQKVFLDTKWAHPFEQTWMSHVFRLEKSGKIRAAALALSPIRHERFDHYAAEERKSLDIPNG